ncbi:fimbrial protein [Ralstonia holmesii]|uniref:fimbrial protein n=1 Tax=Ralstonia holmesii TaxID=3058602 RepID=UPI0028F59297|nr:fimbrial protein [Ralstonia sp. LMG 32967]CAJ0697562.1 hypothetical protein R11007_02615 [Ralstonia sp. LMG 32967]
MKGKTPSLLIMLFNSLSRHTRTALALSLLIGSVAPARALCSFDSGYSTGVMTYTLPSNLVVPRNATIGTVIWTSPLQTVPSTQKWGCNTYWMLGMVNAVGATANAATPSYLPIGNTGLAWVFETYNDIAYGISKPNNSYVMPGTLSFSIKIVAIGPIKAGASIQQGVLGSLSAGGDIAIYTIKAGNTVSVSALTCKTPGVTVKMGDKNYLSLFQGAGTTLAPVNFSIALNECPAGISKVSYQLVPNTQILDAARSVIALDADSTAKGVGLQLLTNAGNPLPLKTNIQFGGYSKLGGNFNLPLKAAYRQTESAVGPGTANSSVTFVMSYE